MTIDWWTLGLQAVNVLILVWLLSRVLWRPMAKAVAARQEAVQTMLSEAKAAQDDAEAARAEIAATRSGMAAEREEMRAEAETKAQAAAKAALDEASAKAETLLKTAQSARERESEAMRAGNAADCAQLAVDIARKLLARLNAVNIDAVFLDHLIGAIEHMNADDKEVLTEATGGIDLIGAIVWDDAAKTKIAAAVKTALGGEPKLNFLTDADLIAGFEMRNAHFSLRDNWKSDLATILKDLKDAA